MGARSISFLYTAESSQGGVCSRQDSMVLAKTGYEDLPQRTRWGRSILRIETMDSAMKLSGSLAWSFGIPLIVICCCRKVRTLIGVYFWSGLLERACEIHAITLSYVGHNSIWRWHLSSSLLFFVIWILDLPRSCGTNMIIFDQVLWSSLSGPMLICLFLHWNNTYWFNNNECPPYYTTNSCIPFVRGAWRSHWWVPLLV